MQNKQKPTKIQYQFLTNENSYDNLRMMTDASLNIVLLMSKLKYTREIGLLTCVLIQ